MDLEIHNRFELIVDSILILLTQLQFSVDDSVTATALRSSIIALFNVLFHKKSGIQYVQDRRLIGKHNMSIQLICDILHNLINKLPDSNGHYQALCTVIQYTKSSLSVPV